MSIFSPPPEGEHRVRPPFCGDRSEEGRCDLYRGHYGPHRDSHRHTSWEVAREAV